MRNALGSALNAVIVLSLLSIVGAGPTVSQENETPSIRTTTSEVLLDFVVRDKNAKIIRNLRPDEIQVFEDGVPQTLRHFEFYDGQTQSPGAPGPTHLGTREVTNQNGQDTNAPASPPTINELRDMSVVSVVIANLDPRDRALTVDAMHQFVKNELKPNTYVGVFRMDMGGLHLLQSYTNDGEKISAAVVDAATSVRTGLYQGIGLQTVLNGGDWPVTAPEGLYPANAPGPTGPVAASAFPGLALDTTWANAMEDAYQASIRTIAPLHDLVGAQAAIPGRKVVLLFMSGLPMSSETHEALQSVVSAANRANVTIYAFTSALGYGFNDSGRQALQTAANASMQQQLAAVTGDNMVTPTQVVAMDVAEYSITANSTGSLADFVEATGGALLRPSTDMIQPLHEAMEGVRTHYELTYAPTDTAVDGSFRKIEVKVTRPGARVFARNGYYALPILNGQQIYPFEIATMKAINTQPDLHQFDFHATTLEFRPGTVRNQFAFIFQAPTRDLTVTTDEKWAKVHVCVTALIKNDKGEVVDKISKDIPYDLPIATKAEMEKGTVSFTAPFFLAPGHYTIDIAAVDRQSMKASVSRSTLDVEQDPGFTMSDVSVARRVDSLDGPVNAFNPLEARGATITPELGDVVTPDTGGALEFYAVAYPQAPVDASVNASLEIYQAGKLVMKSPPSPVSPDKSGAASILAKLPAGKLQPGVHYEAQILFEYKGEKLMRKADFTLAGGGVASLP